MVRRVTPSQFKSMVRQAEQKQRQAIQKYNSEVRKHNAEVKRQEQKRKDAIRKYNQEVRSYNNRLRTQQNRLQSELRKFAQQANTTKYVSIRTSAGLVAQSFERLDRAIPGDDPRPFVNELLDLSQQETANSVGTFNALNGDASALDEDEFSSVEDSELALFLASISDDTSDRWKGAVFALNVQNPDAARHFCTSAREVITQILDVRAPDNAVINSITDCDLHNGRPTRRSKLKYLLHQKGADSSALEEFADTDIEDVLTLFRTFNDGTHGSAGKFNISQLYSIRKRVEDALIFLSKIAA